MTSIIMAFQPSRPLGNSSEAGGRNTEHTVGIGKGAIPDRLRSVTRGRQSAVKIDESEVAGAGGKLTVSGIKTVVQNRAIRPGTSTIAAF